MLDQILDYVDTAKYVYPILQERAIETARNPAFWTEVGLALTAREALHIAVKKYQDWKLGRY